MSPLTPSLMDDLMHIRRENALDISESMIGRAFDRATERERMEASRQDYLRRGNQLTRMARQCNEEAGVCFENAMLIEQQLEVMP